MTTSLGPKNQFQDQENIATEHTVRDLMGLLVLPSLWAGRDGQTILQIMAEAVERVISPLRLFYAEVEFLSNEPPLAELRVDHRGVNQHKSPAWQEAIHEWSRLKGLNASVFSSETPLGLMRMARYSFGYIGRSGTIWFGSTEPSFPSDSHLAIMRAAVSLVANGLQTARANHEREEASRAKDEFLAMLGHELRNPLAPISAAIELINLKYGGLPLDELKVIERQVEHLRRLVDDLMDVSRIARGKVELKTASLDLKAVLTEAVESTRALLEERQHTLQIEYPVQALRILGDHTRLVQVFCNLLINAAKYTEPGGNIRIIVQIHPENQETVTIAVCDNGIGISPQFLPRLFTIFEQGHSTIDRSRGGLGIGLALVKNFVSLHNGTVTAFSEGIGCGAEFTVNLPLLKEAAIGSPGVEQVVFETGGRGLQDSRILIVDDNVDALETMKALLTAYGLKVAVASNPLDALAIAGYFRPTVALLDIGLPIMSGYELASELRKRFPVEALKLIAVTGYGQENDKQKAATSGFDHHLVKPINSKELMGILEEL